MTSAAIPTPTASTPGKSATVVAHAARKPYRSPDRFAAKPFLEPMAPPPAAKKTSPGNEGHPREVLGVVASGHEDCPASYFACLKVADRVLEVVERVLLGMKRDGPLCGEGHEVLQIVV